MPPISLQAGQQALLALFKEKSPLGPLRVMFEHFGYFFRIPLPGFAPYVVCGPQANRQVLVTERDKLRGLMDRLLSPGQLPQPVDHSYSAADMARAGRGIEKIVLSKALKLVLEERVFLHRNRAIIFE
ncbi:MAG: hypothetical protein WA821_18210 [Anaerolineales bacterium]